MWGSRGGHTRGTHVTATNICVVAPGRDHLTINSKLTMDTLKGDKLTTMSDVKQLERAVGVSQLFHSNSSASYMHQDFQEATSETKRILRKVDVRLVPMLALLYGGFTNPSKCDRWLTSPKQSLHFWIAAISETLESPASIKTST